MPRRARSKTDPAAAPTDGAKNGDDLDRYEGMRDFERTPEPPPSPATPVERDGPLTFVIQKHRATRLHYDLRLEVDGVLKSWPIPRGPSTDPKERRLAVMTEDHPFDYGTFEGLIPKGQYGAGEVVVWDRGTYSPDEGGYFSFHDRDDANRRMREDIEAGKVSVHFRGHKMKGSWALVKTTQAPNSWLALKHRDDAVDSEHDLTDLDASVISGLTIADLQAGRRLPEVQPDILDPAGLPGAKRAPLPGTLLPMQASLGDGPFSDERWLFEPKLDGVRVLALVEDGKATLRSRRGLDMTAQYPGLAVAFGRQPAHTMVLDGEIVALDDRGVPSFERLQQRLNLVNAHEIQQAERTVPALCYVFDLLYIDGVDLRRVPLVERKRMLQRMLLPSPTVRLMDYVEGEGQAAYEAWVGLGLEGVVAKHRDSVYETGRRSNRWVKLKHRTTDEFLVCGYTKGEGSRGRTFGALVLGTRDEQGRLIHVGQAGSGFDDRGLAAMLKQLEPLRTDAHPFEVTPTTLPKDITWVRPEVVVEAEYSNYTSDQNLRAPVFKRLRPDKAPHEVRMQAPLASPSGPVVASASAGTSLEEQVAGVLDQLEATKRQQFTLEVGEHRIALSNLDKEMWPAFGEQRPLTKRDLISYYARTARVLLPQLRDRPLTMTRYPNGIEGKFFYQKHVDSLPGDFVETVTSYSSDAGSDQDYILVNNLPTLLWLGQVADLALHTSLARVDPEPDGHHLSADFSGSREQVRSSLLNYPDFILFDLDPYIYSGKEGKGEEPELNRRAFLKTCETAGWLKELLDSAGLASFLKTSGATGLHIYVPVIRHYDYAAIRGVADTFGGFLVRAHPKEITMEWTTEKRAGKVFMDANQNARHKNLAAAYSPRSKAGAPVSMPLRWDELGKVYPTDFTILTADARIERAGDLWANILEAKQDLAALLG
ncbi:MAG: ATP-dependent DNA ligase [Dehalococcoidia bacterium]|nr:ATP-dependent DNA ligase [Dehalococcoidia bacterium]